MSEQSNSTASGSSPGDDLDPSQPLNQHLTKLQNLLRRNQNEFTDRQRATQERADIEEQWIRDEVEKCDEVHKVLDEITREDRAPNGLQNTGIYDTLLYAIQENHKERLEEMLKFVEELRWMESNRHEEIRSAI